MKLDIDNRQAFVIVQALTNMINVHKRASNRSDDLDLKSTHDKRAQECSDIARLFRTGS